MNPNDLLLIAKKMGLEGATIRSDGHLWYRAKVLHGAFFTPFIPYDEVVDLLSIMCHFRVWIDDKPDGSQFCAYHYSGQEKIEVLRDGPVTPEGIVSVVLELALEMSK